MKPAVFSPADGVNVVYGENGQGKTNLIEGIWLFTGCRSFRSTKDKDVVQFGCDKSGLKLNFFAAGRSQSAEMTVENTRKIELNGVPLSSGRQMMGKFNAVVFTPLHLSIIKDGPEERRRFMDIAISQLRPNYAKVYLEYQRALLQRNAALRGAAGSSAVREMLFVWERELAAKGSYIISERIKYLERLKEKVCPIYDEISSGREEISLRYQEHGREHGEDRMQIFESLLKALESKRESDMERCFTSVGPHRESFNVSLSGVSARVFGSQGQQRSAALSLKLAEAQIIRDITGEEPVILLDDVFSELDPLRRSYIISHLQNRQVFITCCDISQTQELKNVTAFEMKDGELH